jgi:hypothetical protein
MRPRTRRVLKDQLSCEECRRNAAQNRASSLSIRRGDAEATRARRVRVCYARIRIEVQPENSRLSRVVRYRELPDKHLLPESDALGQRTTRAVAAEEDALGSRGITSGPALEARGTDLANSGVTPPPSRAVGSRLETLA